MLGVYVNIHEAPLNYSDRIIVQERARTAQNTRLEAGFVLCPHSCGIHVSVNAVWILEGGNKYFRLYRTQHKFVFISTGVKYQGEYHLGPKEERQRTLIKLTLL
jgi:hypothetical protein